MSRVLALILCLRSFFLSKRQPLLTYKNKRHNLLFIEKSERNPTN